MSRSQPRSKQESRFTGQGSVRRQRGYLLMSTLIALPIISLVGLWFFNQELRSVRLAHDTADGSQAAQFAVGLRGYIALAQNRPDVISTSTQTGVDWLKSPACGGPSLATDVGWPEEGFVPCSYTGGLFGPLYQTDVTRDPFTNLIEARTTFKVPPLSEGPRATILAAERIVQGALANQTLPANGMFFTAFANTATAANGPVPPDLITPANEGRVLMVASNAPSNDLWLRTDGTNAMQANLNMGRHSIENVWSARFEGDVQMDNRLHVANGITTSEIHLSSINKFLSEGVYYAETFSGPVTVPKPDCSQAGGIPAIYVGIQNLGELPDEGMVMLNGGVDVDANWNTTPYVQGVQIDLVPTGTNYTIEKTPLRFAAPSGFRYMVMTRCR